MNGLRSSTASCLLLFKSSFATTPVQLLPSSTQWVIPRVSNGWVRSCLCCPLWTRAALAGFQPWLALALPGQCDQFWWTQSSADPSSLEKSWLCSVPCSMPCSAFCLLWPSSSGYLWIFFLLSWSHTQICFSPYSAFLHPSLWWSHPCLPWNSPWTLCKVWLMGVSSSHLGFCPHRTKQILPWNLHRSLSAPQHSQMTPGKQSWW